MRETFTRFLFYLFITIVITGPFRSSWPDPSATEPLAVKFAFYFFHYGIGWLFWTLLLLSVHETFRYIRRHKTAENAPTKELPTPNTALDTQGLTSVYVPPGHEDCPECRQPIDAIPDKMLKSLEENRKLLETRPPDRP